MDHREAVDTLASERYLLNEMTAAERDSFEEHYFSCDECADDVRAAAAMRNGARAGLIESDRPRSAPAGVVPIASRRRASIVLPWAAAATFAGIATYQALNRPPSTADRPIALAPLTLRPISRGADPTVSPGADGIVTLAVDLGSRSFSEIAFELRAADGTPRSSGRAPAPAGGAPLLLMVPASLLDGSDVFVLTVQDPGNGDLTREEYRFRVESR